MKLLIVEENSDMRRLIRTLVEDLELPITECREGGQALAACAQTRPDWVLLDLNMAEVDGIAVTRQISEAYPHTRVVVVTDLDSKRLRAAAHEAGACEYVLKEDLLAVRRILRADPPAGTAFPRGQQKLRGDRQ